MVGVPVLAPRAPALLAGPSSARPGPTSQRPGVAGGQGRGLEFQGGTGVRWAAGFRGGGGGELRAPETEPVTRAAQEAACAWAAARHFSGLCFLVCKTEAMTCDSPGPRDPMALPGEKDSSIFPVTISLMRVNSKSPNVVIRVGM